MPLLDQLGAALGRLHADRDDSAHAGLSQFSETAVELADLLAAHGAVQAAEEHHQ